MVRAVPRGLLLSFAPEPHSLPTLLDTPRPARAHLGAEAAGDQHRRWRGQPEGARARHDEDVHR